MLPLRHRRLWIALSAVLVAAVVYGSLKPDVSLPVPTGFDKLEHFTAYFVLALWFTGIHERARYAGVAVGLLVLGASMEILQGLMHMGRTAEVLDMVANAIGVAAGLALALWLTGGWARRVEAWLSLD
jgi:VanZ family protein